MAQKYSWIARGIWSLVLVHLACHTVQAVLPTLPGAPDQCGAYMISWNRTNLNGVDLPTTLRLIPVNTPGALIGARGYPTMNLSVPVIQTIPESAWAGGSRIISYIISQLPFRMGEAYIVAMDYGSGIKADDISSTYFVTSIPASASCLTPTSYADGVLFNLSTYSPPQCGPLVIRTQQARSIRAFVLGGSTLNLALPPVSTGIMTTAWNVSVTSGRQFVLLYEGLDGKNASSGILDVIDEGYGSKCLGTDPWAGASSTGVRSGVNIVAVLGGILSAIALVAPPVLF